MIEQKILLVTGASSAVGTELINSTGIDYDVIWGHFCENEKWIDKIDKTIRSRIRSIRADFSVAEQVEQMADEIIASGDIPAYIVHLSAPRAFNAHFHKCNWEDYQNAINISFRSIVVLLEKMIPHMVKVKFGRIVFMLTSYVLGNVPPKYQSAYISTKYALYGLMRNLASEYAEKGITVNAVSPDMMETDFVTNIPEHVIQMNAEKNPLHRNIRVTDVIPAMSYLLSDDAEAVTGQNIGITGG